MNNEFNHLKLNQLIDNKKTEYKGIDSIVNDYISTLI
jgi:hypothetical protein